MDCAMLILEFEQLNMQISPSNFDWRVFRSYQCSWRRKKGGSPCSFFFYLPFSWFFICLFSDHTGWVPGKVGALSESENKATGLGNMIIFLVASASVDGYLADRGAESDHNCIRICHMCLHICMINHNGVNEIVNTVYASHIRREVSLETAWCVSILWHAPCHSPPFPQAKHQCLFHCPLWTPAANAGMTGHLRLFALPCRLR